MNLVHNERIKLTAAWFNALATALVAAGLFAPLAASFYGLAEMHIGLPSVAATVLGCLAGGLTLHVTGWALLGRLRE